MTPSGRLLAVSHEPWGGDEMAEMGGSTRLPVPAQRVWDLIGGFNALADWHPEVVESEIEGPTA